MLKKALVFIVALTAVASLEVMVNEGTAHAQALVPYTHAPGAYAISFPVNWERRLLATGPIALSPPEFPGDTFRDNVNVVHETLPMPMTAAQYAAASMPAMTTQLQQFAVLEQGPVVPGNPNSGYYVVYQHTMNQRLQVIAFFQTGTPAMGGRRGYVITCTSTPQQFARWRQFFLQIAMTFTYNRSI